MFMGLDMRYYFVHKMPVDSHIGCKFRVKCSSHVPALLHQDRITLIARKGMDIPSRLANYGSADKDRFDGPPIQIQLNDAAIDLTPVTVPLNGKIHQPKRLLLGVKNVLCKQNGARTGAEHRLLAAELEKGVEQPFFAKQFKHGRTFASRDNQSVNLFKIVHGAHFYGRSASALQCPLVGGEVSLQR